MTTEWSRPTSEQDIIRASRGTRTLREYATLLGVSFNAVLQWETAMSRPTDDRLMAWMRHANSDVSTLGRQLFIARHGEALMLAMEKPEAG